MLRRTRRGPSVRAVAQASAHRAKNGSVVTTAETTRQSRATHADASTHGRRAARLRGERGPRNFAAHPNLHRGFFVFSEEPPDEKDHSQLPVAHHSVSTARVAVGGVLIHARRAPQASQTAGCAAHDTGTCAAELPDCRLKNMMLDTIPADRRF